MHAISVGFQKKLVCLGIGFDLWCSRVHLGAEIPPCNHWAELGDHKGSFQASVSENNLSSLYVVESKAKLDALTDFAF